MFSIAIVVFPRKGSDFKRDGIPQIHLTLFPPFTDDHLSIKSGLNNGVFPKRKSFTRDYNNNLIFNKNKNAIIRFDLPVIKIEAIVTFPVAIVLIGWLCF